MKKIIAASAVLLVLFSDQSVLAAPKTIVAFGDSTTALRGRTEVYATLLARELSLEGGPVRVINAGVGGHTTADAKKRFEKDVLEHQPDVVVIQFGINDSAVDVWKTPAATTPRVPLADYRRNLTEMVRTLKQRGTRVVLMTPNAISWTPALLKLYGRPPYRPDDVDGMNVVLRDYVEAVRGLARDEGAELVDVFEAFQQAARQPGGKPGGLCSDGMHPDHDGHRLVANLLIAQLTATAPAPRGPNIVLIFVDNFGNGDLGCFGSKLHRTPHVDRLAAEGTKFTSFYVASGVCTPSRAALLTGCYPRRVNLHVSDTNSAVLQPVARKGLQPAETTLAEVLKSKGYATACIGKWHLGDQPDFLPTRQGFDEFFGIPYSDDMTKERKPEAWPDLPLMRGEKVIEAPVDRDYLVKRCTEEAIAFIERNQTKPFFVYLPHTMPGSTGHPFSSPGFRGKSKNGDYGDSVEEIDWSTGEIMAAVRRLKLDGDTLVIWTSDNGAVHRNPPQGSNAPYKGPAYDTSEGAMRVPCVMRWPGKIPAGRVQDELCSTMDLLPTLAKLADAPFPSQPIDGHDIRPLLFGERDAKSPWDAGGFFYYRMEQLQAVRAGEWKLYLDLPNKFVTLNRKTAPSRLELYDVRSDVAEEREIAAQNPEVVQRLLAMAERARAELGDMDQPGTGQRPAGSIETPKPLVP